MTVNMYVQVCISLYFMFFIVDETFNFNSFVNESVIPIPFLFLYLVVAFKNLVEWCRREIVWIISFYRLNKKMKFTWSQTNVYHFKNDV